MSRPVHALIYAGYVVEWQADSFTVRSRSYVGCRRERKPRMKFTSMHRLDKVTCAECKYPP